MFLIGKNLGNQKDKNWKNKFEESQNELNSITKQYKKEKKKAHQLEQHQINAQTKLNETEEKYLPLNESLTQQLQATQAENQTQQTSIEKLNADLTYINHQLEQVKKERSRLNDKYATDMKASKGWRHIAHLCKLFPFLQVNLMLFPFLLYGCC